jgi:hypothetical protein
VIIPGYFTDWWKPFVTKNTLMGNGMKLLEKVSIAASACILLAALVFWTIQIRGVLELLRLAYG